MRYIYSGLLFIFLTGCIPPRQTVQRNPIRHTYDVTVTDSDNTPVKDAIVTFDIINNSYSSKPYNIISGNVTSDVNGKVPTISADVVPKIWEYQNSANYGSKLIYDVSSAGYYTKKGEASSYYGTDDDNRSSTPKSLSDRYKNQVEQVKITLIKPSDYLDVEFMKSNKLMAGKTLAFLDDIKIKGYLGASVLKQRSIKLNDFKKNKYLTFTFENTNSYNSLRLSKYDIGKQLFDDVIRKVLSPLNDFISDDTFYGYDITVIGYTKNFTEDKYGKGTAIHYRYLLPQSAVKSYKDKDISGQQLVDKSIVLMDDERVDIKLQ